MESAEATINNQVHGNWGLADEQRSDRPNSADSMAGNACRTAVPPRHVRQCMNPITTKPVGLEFETLEGLRSSTERCGVTFANVIPCAACSSKREPMDRSYKDSNGSTPLDAATMVRQAESRRSSRAPKVCFW